MSSSDTDAAIKTAIVEFQSPQSFWPIALIDRVCKEDPFILFTWAAECLRTAISMNQHVIDDVLLSQIQQAHEAENAGELATLLDYWDDLRPGDKLVSAHIHLLLLKQSLLLGNAAQYRTSALWFFIIFCEHGHSIESGFTIVIDTFRKHFDTGADP